MQPVRILFFLIPSWLFGQTQGDWKTINQSNYSLKYPSTWEPDESEQMGTKLILFSALESSTDTFRKNVNLIIQDLTGYNLDLDGYSKMSEDQIKKIISNSQIIESARTRSNSNPCYKIIYTGDQGGFHLKFEQYYFVISNKAYVLTFTAEQNNFEKFKDTGEGILNTFKIKE